MTRYADPRRITRIFSMDARMPAAFPLNKITRIATLATIAIAFAIDGRASSMTSFEVIETMLTAQESDSIFMGSLFGPDSNSTLQFSATYDPTAQTFSYATLAGQRYEGLAFSMVTTGSFDTQLGQYDWSTIAALGTQTWTGSSSGVWSDSNGSIVPDDDDCTGFNGPKVDVNSSYTYQGDTYTVKGSIPTKKNADGTTSSCGKLTYKSPYKSDVPYDFPSTDVVNKDGTVEVHANGHDESFSLNGNLPDGGGLGNFDVRIAAAVPEPTTLTLFAAGSLLIAAGRLRRRKRAP